MAKRRERPGAPGRGDPRSAKDWDREREFLAVETAAVLAAL